MTIPQAGDRRRIEDGFTLIELMVAIAIVAILAAIAYPSYAAFLARGKRADARAALLENAQFLEGQFTVNGYYSSARDSGTAPTLPLPKVPRNEGAANYNITATVTNTTYTLTATPAGSMVGDKCLSYRMDQTGAQYLWDGSLRVNNAALEAECWNR